ncbi:MAG TPA: D-alanyl-D-alanine carboxypeptidase/D-alanyl-D-alanine-endopeptidase, partial [Cytophagales bacterium]|nr:D-alanyl-D-alanine carboxypeptidase/D-alanyl-D-alanine-endopeptidase [Cytophagales bacterium]
MAHKTLLLLMSLLYLTAYAQPSLDSEVQSMMKDKDLRAAHMGISVTELGTMKSIYQYQGQKMFSTASCLKLLTTACALEYLGEQYQFSTKIYLNGQINNEELNGDIIIEGSGDPTFASSRYGQSLGSVLEDISKSLKKLNISKINGHLCYDVSKFDINPVSPKTYWLDLGNYFGGATWPVNIDENIYRVTFSRSLKVGDSTKVLKIDPPIDITLDNRVTIKGKTDEAFIYCAPYSSYGYIKGTLPPSIEPYTIKGAMPQPLQFFGRELVKKLHSYHIEVPNGILYLSKSTGDKRLV